MTWDNLSGGEIAEITISECCEYVRLLNNHNLRHAIRYGHRHKYNGGHFKESPVRFEIPRAGHWYVVVDLGGYAGEVGSSARFLSGEAISG